MSKSKSLSPEETMAKASELAIQGVSNLRFGIHDAKPFMEVIADFLRDSPNFERDNAYVEQVYRTLIKLQNHILGHDPANMAKKELTLYTQELNTTKTELQSLLYHTARERNLSPGMRSPVKFIEHACNVTEKVRDKFMVTAQSR